MAEELEIRKLPANNLAAILGCVCELAHVWLEAAARQKRVVKAACLHVRLWPDRNTVLEMPWPKSGIAQPDTFPPAFAAGFGAGQGC